MSKASIHIKPCNIAQSEAHNRRDKDYLKSLNPDQIYIDTFLTPFNKSYVTPELEFTSLQEYYEELKAMVKEKTGRAMQEKDVEYTDKNGRKRVRKGSSPLREGVAIIEEGTTLDDLKRFTMAVQKRWYIKAIQIHIHRDEGHYEENERGRRIRVPNYHAHIVWDWMDHKTGKSYKLSEKDMSEMQDLLADMLKMERGQKKSETGLEHLDREEFILKKLKNEQKAVKEKTEALELEIKGLDFDEEELSVPEVETDWLVKKAKDDIQKELSTPVPVVGREKWREERLEAVKSILAQMENDFISAKGSQKRKILSYGKALYKQTKREIYKTSEENKQLKGVNQRLTKENDSLKGKLASVDENAVRKLRTDLAAANQRAENADLAVAQEKERTNQEWRRAEQERNRADDAEAQVREILSVPEIKQFWERILRQKAFLEEMNQRIAKAVKALYDFAKNRDLIFSKEAEVSIGNGIIAEAILKGLDPTDEGQRKKAAKSLLGKVNWKGTYQSSCDLAETRTEQFCEEITVPKEIVANLLLAAGGKGGVTVGGGGAGSNDDLTNWDGTKKKDRGRRR